MDSATLQAIQEGLINGDVSIDTHSDEGSDENGWSFHVDPPPFGDRCAMQGQYLARATSGAQVGLYGLDPAEAFHPRSTADETGEAYDANKYNYVLTFSMSGISLPKVGAFWSLSMYNTQNFFVPNIDEKFSIGHNPKDLMYEELEDGSKSLAIYIQNTEPSQGKSNWLPAPPGLASDPDGRFNLV